MTNETKLGNENNKLVHQIKNEQTFSYSDNISKIFQIVFPLILYGISYTLQQSVTLSFLSKRFPKEQLHIINAIGLCNIYFNCTVVSISYGLLAGITSLGSNAYGAKEYYLMGLYIHRGRIVCMTFVVFTGIINFFFGHHILSLFIAEEKGLKIIEIYIKCLVFYEIIDSLYHVNVEYLSILEKGYVNLGICVTNSILHFLWCYIYIYILNLGVLGAGLAQITTQALNLICTSLYIHIANPCPESYFCINRHCFVGLWNYLKYTTSELAILICQFWSLEILGLIVLFISKLDFASYILVMNITFNVWAISYGFHCGTTILVGTLITETTIDIVKKTITLSFIVANVFLACIILICFFLAQKIISLFIHGKANPELTELALICLNIHLFNYMFELNSNMFSGIIRAFGRQKFIIIVMIITFYPLLMITSIILGKILKLGAKGIFISLSIAYLAGFISYLIYYIRLNLNHIRIEIEERICYDQEIIKEDELK